jgi:hypothetical protein
VKGEKTNCSIPDTDGHGWKLAVLAENTAKMQEANPAT